MPTSSRLIALILGSGPNIGAASAARFKSLGYEVALVSRKGPETPTKSAEGYLQIGADLANADAYAGIYAAVKDAFGSAGHGGGDGDGDGDDGVPSVVVFNAASLTRPDPSDPSNIFSTPLDGLQHDVDLSVKGAFVAAREAYRLWTTGSGGVSDARKEEERKKKRQFIFTGNCLTKTILPVPGLVTLGIIKNASAYWVGLADKLYKNKGLRFFYADQREPNGGPAYNVNAEAHAELFTRLAQDPEPWPSYITFTDGTKVVEFEEGRWN